MQIWVCLGKKGYTYTKTKKGDMRKSKSSDKTLKRLPAYEIDKFIQWLTEKAVSEEGRTIFTSNYGKIGIPLKYLVNVYEAGRDKTLPDLWLPLYERMKLEKSDEYKKYLKLKEKYEPNTISIAEITSNEIEIIEEDGDDNNNNNNNKRGISKESHNQENSQEKRKKRRKNNKKKNGQGGKLTDTKGNIRGFSDEN